ncbi:hypothetical protein AN964_03695 [Heyndrickxia shackletonii]|uniref:DUF3885 domain-containing protein n=2 Tax=Heyndrickxia TaxID=2837504 RepID=A0A0Q3TF79_9BACI|nr:DUF3885 domain-containing protein [Heyndrickxia shackletonii]KQL52710.1 hypothetical protein AN964_03695 [Heyndrickxia shackletonii]NEZ02177.1 DUF3885 domain-containing protein [Heyndrickxia shackletonii]
MPTIHEYLNGLFPGVTLGPSLIDQWKINLHFEFARELYQFIDGSDEINLKYFEKVFFQASSIFNSIFSDDDQVFLLVNVYRENDLKYKSKLGLYLKYISDKNVRYHLQQSTFPYPFPEEEEEEPINAYTIQYSIKCMKRDIQTRLILKALTNRDFPPLKPRFSDELGMHYDVFFVNVSKNVIFFMHDDTGCEVISNSLETLLPLYERYGDWICPFCKDNIDKLFK